MVKEQSKLAVPLFYHLCNVTKLKTKANVCEIESGSLISFTEHIIQYELDEFNFYQIPRNITKPLEIRFEVWYND